MTTQTPHHKSDLISSLSLLESPEKLQNIGSAIVKQAIAKAVLTQTKTGHPKQSLVIKKGEVIPEGFRAILKIPVDAEGKAVANWPNETAALEREGGGDYFEVCYEDAGAGYCECWPDAPDAEERMMSITNTRLQSIAGITKAQMEHAFSPEEIVALKRFGLVH